MKYFINTNQKNNNAQRKKPFSLNLRQKAGIFLLSSLTIGLASAMPSMDVISSKSIRISLDGTESYSFAPLMPDDLLKESDFVNSNDVFVMPEDDIIPSEDLASTPGAGTDQDWQKYSVQRGDTFSGIFNKMNIPQDQMYALLQNKDAKIFNKIYPGQIISFFTDKESNLKEVIVKKDATHSYVFTSDNDTFLSRIDIIESSWEPKVIKGSISGSFYVSAKKAGLSPSQIQRMVNIFQFQVNFSRDLKDGDEFTAVISKEYIKGMGTGKSELKAAEITTKGRKISLFKHENGRFYNEKGESMESGFIRTPLLAKARVSSNFSYNRKHPLTGKITNHHGTDYAVLPGTVVIAPSDGEVVGVKKHHLAGNYIVIRHGRQYTTRYLHLSKFLVKQGDKVKRGDKIALSGNTGRSTGPHLHYELHINNKPVNSLTAKLPMVDSLKGKDKKEFLLAANKYKSEIHGVSSSKTRIAKNSTERKDNTRDN